ncbi:MAG TPA: DUF2231 domain-containing protein [Polyangiaceae bacterium]|nr:DUF2231 domain-containing protein [Polyangiaceae bacterium]
MESRAKLLGHPVHQMLIPLPIGAFGLAVVSDAVASHGKSREAAVTAKRALEFGVVTALVAAPFGVIDWLGITPRTRATRVGFWHGLGNLGVLGLFAASRLLRNGRHVPPSARWLAVAGLGLAGVTAWLGGELVDRHGIGVSDLVGENAPSSLLRDAQVYAT